MATLPAGKAGQSESRSCTLILQMGHGDPRARPKEPLGHGLGERALGWGSLQPPPSWLCPSLWGCLLSPPVSGATPTAPWRALTRDWAGRGPQGPIQTGSGKICFLSTPCYKEGNKPREKHLASWRPPGGRLLTLMAPGSPGTRVGRSLGRG